MDTPITSYQAPPVTIDIIEDWLLHRGGAMYGGEVVTQLQHALQCATLALADGAPQTLIMAALLHDIGHLADMPDLGGDRAYPHGALGAQLLGELFDASVTEPIRLHVDAKRYLCATNPAYWEGLSEASKRSLEWQGGPFNAQEAQAFIAQPYAEDAVQLRYWDDAAKVPEMTTPSAEAFIALMRSVVLRAEAA